MVKFYLIKIKKNEINPNTGDIWKLKDVPKLWRKKVEIELNDEDIGSRNPNGVYKTTMTLTLKNGG